MQTRTRTLAISLFTALLVAGCGSSDAPSTGPAGDGNGGGNGGGVAPGRTLSVPIGANATQEAIEAFIRARPGDTIRFDCGFYDLTSTLLLTQTEGVTIKGCGMDETVLSFRNSDGVEGLLIDEVRGVVIEDLTVADPAGNGIEMRNVDHGTVRGVRAFWSSGGGRESPNPVTADNYAGDDSPLHVACTDPATQDPDSSLFNGPNADISSPDYTVSDKAGRYGIYPVKSKNILIEETESIGASDAGIYVGQTSTAIIRNSRAAYNVFGFEIENVRHGEYAYNLAECNTGGFLIYDLDNLTQYGERTIMHHNVSRMNNTYNFTSGGFVANVPQGSGMITLAYDRIDVYDNEFIDNDTGGIIHASYELFPEGAGRPTDNKIDFYTEGMRIYRNTFRNNGNGIKLPRFNDLTSLDIAKFLPAIVGLKTATACLVNPGTCPRGAGELGLRGAHIVWDGLLPDYDPDCPYPVDAQGNPLPEEANFPGKPRHTNEEPQPSCHYNAYKFDTDLPDNPRKKPLFFSSCIDADNDFSSDSLTYTNFRGTKGLEAVLALIGDSPLQDLLNLRNILQGLPQFAASLDMGPHDCVAEYGENLEPIEPVVIPPFVPSGELDPAPSEEEVAALCNADVAPGEVNFAAAAVNCPTLSQYNLFQDAEDPTSEPNGRSFPFVLNTKLFSDYSVKYRVAYLPPRQQMTYAAPEATQPSGTMVFPTGTILAKTFSFASGGDEDHVETRLLIKRETSNGGTRWAGLPYIWRTNANGERVAELQMRGQNGIQARWNFEDVNTGERLQGATDNYSVPTANQCLSCHANQDLEPGSAPIGPKVRNFNRAYASESMVVTDQSRHPIAGNNQIAWLCDNGYMTGCPSDLGVDPNTQIATNLARLPKFNVPGDAGFPAGSDEDIEARTRAWLEVNCQHCHNPRGFAANTGYYLDVFRPVDVSYGICKGPTATGAEGSGGRTVDVKPMDADGSILAYRLGPEADTPAAQMPPIARSVVHTQSHALIRDWINNVVVADDSRYPGSESCAGN
ncbi:parallel beta-helix domain-containing protein [Algiphilus sp.]|uniref:parallel beta-helix domain-containing protein n=1 Tax=Algiphilus sp. TaxID=1872431 RepID=UPI001CA653D4|nr:parallel beta-helix domain-containing protein [Algiphilus sp.]MBY8964209.1 right-handed parallel beta-helix repeat-containing protein [Algiphilus acroporae]MCI5061523.1 right-handed parallel beta-helix repeat-containing protein [Algiphilus sp.]MCI5102281.1 right-handed parallel beta-helix repeat-containing protein [Algiphilus sp.]